jgi:hypothetical protein
MISSSIAIVLNCPADLRKTEIFIKNEINKINDFKVFLYAVMLYAILVVVY